jgi:hypothetical protein
MPAALRGVGLACGTCLLALRIPLSVMTLVLALTVMTLVLALYVMALVLALVLASARTCPHFCARAGHTIASTASPSLGHGGERHAYHENKD